MAVPDDLEQIIAGCVAGDADAFALVVDAYGGRCYGYFYRLTGKADISEDLLSELFMKLVEKIGTYKGGSFEGWLFRIASNIFHDYLRGKQRRKKLLEAHKWQTRLEASNMARIKRSGRGFKHRPDHVNTRISELGQT